MKEMNINLNVGDFREGYFIHSILPKFSNEIEKIKKVIVNEEGYLDEVREAELNEMKSEVRTLCEEHDSYRNDCQRIESEIQSEIYTWNESNQLTHIKV
jgi:hypothetical protein